MSLAFETEAQTTSCFTGTTTNPAVSCENAVLNATIDTLNLQMSGQFNEVMTVQVRLTKTSGTIAGTARLYGSNYGPGTTGLLGTGTWDAVGDTLTLANQAVNSHTWTISKPCYAYYRILQSGGTTMAGTMSARALGIKPN